MEIGLLMGGLVIFEVLPVYYTEGEGGENGIIEIGGRVGRWRSQVRRFGGRKEGRRRD